jgi:hypothetical protein
VGVGDLWYTQSQLGRTMMMMMIMIMIIVITTTNTTSIRLPLSP